MNRLKGFKKVAACTLAVLMCASVFSGAESGVMRADKAQAQSAELEENQENIGEAKDSIEDLIAKQEELDKKIAETNDDIDSEEENKKAIEEQIVTVQQTVMALNASISETNDEIRALETSIAEKEIQVNEKHDQIVEGVGDFKERLKAMYVAGNNSYSDIIIGATDFYDMLMKMELVKRVAEHDDKMIDDLITLKDQYEADEAELNAEKADLEAKQAELETKKKAHENQRDKLMILFSESETALDEMEKSKEIYENNLAMIEQEQAEFEKHLEELYMERVAIKNEEKRKADEEKARQEEERRKKEEEEARLQKAAELQRQEAEKRREEREEADRLAAEQAAAAENDSTADTTDSSSSQTTTQTPDKPTDNLSKNSENGYVEKSRFTWPVPGHYQVTYGFGYRNGGSLTGFHRGIDIYDNNIYNAEIVAADEGTVIDVKNYCPHDFGKNYGCGCGGNYGRYCIIEHSGGYWTLYGHANNIVVSVGQHVEKGQVLGYVGSTGHSTGPHTHFEVIIAATQEKIDPIDFLNYTPLY